MIKLEFTRHGLFDTSSKMFSGLGSGVAKFYCDSYKPCQYLWLSRVLVHEGRCKVLILHWYYQEIYQIFNSEGIRLIAVRLLDSGKSNTRWSCTGKCEQTVCPWCTRTKVTPCVHPSVRNSIPVFQYTIFGIWKLTSHQMPQLSKSLLPTCSFGLQIRANGFCASFYTGIKGRYWQNKLILAKKTGSQLMLRLAGVMNFIGFSHAKCWISSRRAYLPELH